MNATLDLTDATLDEIARRAAALVSTITAPEAWLTVDQAAEHMAISTSQLYSLCSARQTNGLPVQKEGTRSYFRASELDAWRASQ